MSRGFKNALCGLAYSQSGMFCDEIRRGCIRRDGHTGPHRSKNFEWDYAAFQGPNEPRPREPK